MDHLHTSSTRSTRLIKASPETVYQAFTNPEALAVWLAPGDMTGQVHHFDAKPGGGYEMSLFYPGATTGSPGKTTAREDRFRSRFVELTPYKKIIQAINFVTDNPQLTGEMMMEVALDPVASGTQVTILFTHIPPGIKPADNEAGTEQSLDKLAKYVEGGK